MARVLITGVAGFIGSTLARALLAEGAEVRGLDDLSTGKLENIQEICKSIDFRHGSILDRAAVNEACEGVDYIFHEAAIPSVPISVDDPIGTNGPNLQGTLYVLEAARKANVKRLMYAASSAAYGDSPEMPKRETMLPAPISPYAVQKVAGEYYLASYAQMYGVDTVSLRYFNIFGPRQDPTSQYSGVLAKFISLMLTDKAPTIFGDGLTSRDFTYVDNVVNANLLAAKASTKLSGRIFNVATARSVTLLAAYEEIKRIVGYKGDLCWAEERKGDIKHSVADISVIKRELNYKVHADLTSGLEKTIAWYRTVS